MITITLDDNQVRDMLTAVASARGSLKHVGYQEWKRYNTIVKDVLRQIPEGISYEKVLKEDGKNV